MLATMRAAPATYRRHRELLVFATHLAFTHMRAALVKCMYAQAAVGWKGGGFVTASETPLQLFIRCGEARGERPRCWSAVGVIPSALYTRQLQHMQPPKHDTFEHSTFPGWRWCPVCCSGS